MQLIILNVAVDLDVSVEEIDVDDYDDNNFEADDSSYNNVELCSSCTEKYSFSDIYDVNDMMVNSYSVINSEVIEYMNVLKLRSGLVIRRLI